MCRTLLFLSLLLVAACQREGAYVPGEWLGHWTGPEGTYLEIAQEQDHLEITISNLDGPKTYRGKMINHKIEFTRDGKNESIHLSNGRDTGMKWLADKQNCLVIKSGEGYCRD